MFTGLVKDIGQIEAVDEIDGGRRLAIRTGLETDDIEVGESIAVDGACLTVTALDGDTFSVDLSAETLAKTTFEAREAGDGVHLERALRVGDRLGGHFVQGHVDAVGRVRDRERDGEALRLSIEVPDGFERWLVPKGSITVDGVSLTVNDVDERRFGVALIPHTLDQTKLGSYRPGDGVNLEGDMLGKYVERLIEGDRPAGQSRVEELYRSTDTDDG